MLALIFSASIFLPLIPSVPSAPAAAAFPGNNGKIVFVGLLGDADGEAIYVMKPDGSGQRELIETGQFDAPAWSPDGTKIAFDKDSQDVYVMNSNGSCPTNITTFDTYGGYRPRPAWSPDGLRILFSHEPEGEGVIVDDGDGPTWHQPPAELYVVNLDGTGLERITHTPKDGEENAAWSPDGTKIAYRNFIGYLDSPTGRALNQIYVMNADGTGRRSLTPESMVTDDPQWSPDGSKIAFENDFHRSIWVMDSNGSGLKKLTPENVGEEYDPAWSPDGKKIVFHGEDPGGLDDKGIFTMNADGSGRTNVPRGPGIDYASGYYARSPDWQPKTARRTPPLECPPGANELTVDLRAFGLDGTSLQGVITVAQTFQVKLTITNGTPLAVSDFSFARGAPLVIDERSTGGIQIVSGPDPPIPENLTLEPKQSVSYFFEVSATADGVAAAHTKISALDEENIPQEDAHSLRFDIENGQKMTDALGQWVLLNSMTNYLQKTYRDFHTAMTARGNELHRRLSAILTPAQRLAWFGSETELVLSPFDYAMGQLRGVPPEMVAASFPKVAPEGVTFDQMNAEYNRSFKQELGHGVSDWVEGYKGLASDAKKALQDSWGEAMLASYAVFGTMTPEEQLQWNAYSATLVNGIVTSEQNIYNGIKREIPKWKENGTYAWQAALQSALDITLQSPDIKAQMAQETKWRQNMLKLADGNPLLFMREWAKRDAEIANLVLPLVLDTLAGGGVFRAAGLAKKLIVKGKGAAVMRSGVASGVLTEKGVVKEGSKTAIARSTSEAPHGPPAADLAVLERRNYLDDIEGATVVQSSDLGKVYELPNVGGVPEVTLDAKAGMLGELETEYAAAHNGTQLKLAEILKPSSPLRQADGVAKTELTPFNTGKPAMLDAGAPRATLSEANVWQSPDPRKSKGFKDLSKPRQESAVTEWQKANERWAEFENPPPGSKAARMKECIGQRARVPLDEAPNSQGIQRFVTAEYEQIDVIEGNARAKLFRVKYYEVEVVDTNTGQVLNRKTVVDVPEAVPQTPDADAVGLAKVVGHTEDGLPILEPLSRAEREFVEQRYIDKNVKARRKKPGTPGAIPDAAEHGTTLICSDACAKAAGKLLPSYGVPFIPEIPGLAFLKRIAPHVAKHLIPRSASAAEAAAIIERQYKQMVADVRSAGGFGQHAVIVTSDSRYLGEVNVASW